MQGLGIRMQTPLHRLSLGHYVLHLTVVCSAHANMLSSNYPDLPEEPQQPSGFPFPKRTFGCQTVVKCSVQPHSGFFCIITSLKIWCSSQIINQVGVLVNSKSLDKSYTKSKCHLGNLINIGCLPHHFKIGDYRPV